MSAGFTQACPHCGMKFNTRIAKCPACGKARQDPVVEALKPEPAPQCDASADAPAVLTVLETPLPPAAIETYIAVQPLRCRVGGVIVTMKVGDRVSDQGAIAELLKNNQPIRPLSSAEGFMTCPCCGDTFRPTAEQLRIATATSAAKPNRAA